MSELRNEFARYKSARAAMSWADDDADDEVADEPEAVVAPPPVEDAAPPDPDLLPDPAAATVRATLISSLDHLVEPPHLFAGRLPAAVADRGPAVVATATGEEVWAFDGATRPLPGPAAAAGRRAGAPPPVRYAAMRRGCWDAAARVRDMDLAGIWASVNLPSALSGAGGVAYAQTSDVALGKACVRAFNDWYAEEWVGAHPDRFVPIGITYLADAEAAAAEIRRNADRGFRAVSIPARPEEVGLPAPGSGWWDPVLATCAETTTVVYLQGSPLDGTPAAGVPPEVVAPAVALRGVAEWIWSGVPSRLPDLRLVVADGGTGWVPALLDRLELLGGSAGPVGWPSGGLSPIEVLQRNFWFCTVDDPSIWPVLARIGVDRVLAAAGYPAQGSVWPSVQDLLATRLADRSDEEIRRVTHQNAAALLGHALPPDPRP